jgi:hypothetical protein
MARLARLAVPGHPHHVTQRGVRRMEAFSVAIGDAIASLNAGEDTCDSTGPTTPERIWRAIDGIAPGIG